MKTHLTIMILMCLGVNTAISQSADREIFPNQVSIHHNQAVKSFSGDFVSMSPLPITEYERSQEITAQTAIVAQIGMQNLVLLTQSGELNYANIKTDGNFNRVYWNQAGIYNWISFNLNGDYYKISGDQIGDHNQLLLNYKGAGVEQSFQQIGDYQFLEFSGIPIPMSVSQTGNGATLIIDNR